MGFDMSRTHFDEDLTLDVVISRVTRRAFYLNKLLGSGRPNDEAARRIVVEELAALEWLLPRLRSVQRDQSGAPR
jgi:hypothetical protein